MRALALWRSWISSRFFFLHGTVLIALGLPLTCAGGSTEGRIIFSLGLILVFTGPFILLYADRVRSLFLDSVSRMGPSAARMLILVDAALRVGFGLFMVCAYAHRVGL